MTRTSVRLRFVLAGIAVVALVAPVPVLAATQSTTMTMNIDPQTMDYGDHFVLHATVTADRPADDASQPHGTVTWYHYYSYPFYYSYVASEALAEGTTEVTHESYGLEPGENQFFARFTSDNDSYAGTASPTYVATVGPAPSTTTLTGPSTVEVHSPLSLTAQMQSDASEAGGTLSIYRVGNPTAVCTRADMNSQGQGGCTFDADTVGTFGYYAVYSGGTLVTGSTSPTINVTVTANLVHAHSVATQYTTFYPVKDGYRDTVKISGFRDELITPTIKIYSPTGKLIKTVAIAAGYDTFAYSWNGRNSAGTIYAAGKYKVVVSLKDGFNLTKSYTIYVNLSKKKLIWHSSSVTKKGSSYSASGHVGGGSVARNTTSGYVRLRAPEYYTDWAGAGWEFTLPTAVAYKGIIVRVYAARAWIAGPAPRLGSQNFTTCSYVVTGSWSESCFDSWKDIGNSSGAKAWYSTATLSSVHRSGTKVRSSVGDTAGTIYVYLARVSFQYATLGY